MKQSQVWFGAFLGTSHELVHLHNDFLREWNRREEDIEWCQARHNKYKMYFPALLVQWFQLELT